MNLSVADLPEDVYSYSYSHSVDDELYNDSLDIDLGLLLDRLSKREKDVITMFYGINCEEKDLKEIVKVMKLTKERIRQNQRRCIEKNKRNNK